MSQGTGTPEGSIVAGRPAVRVASRQPAAALLERAREAAGTIDVAAVGSTGVEGIEPLLIATDGGTTRFYARPEPERAREVARALASSRPPPAGSVTVEHDPVPDGLPTPTSGPLSVGRRDALGPAGWVRPASLADYEAVGGMTALEIGPERTFERVDGLAGRGWGDAAADEPIVGHWRAAQAAEGDPAVVVNAHGNQADRLLVGSSPLPVIEGALLAVRVIGGTEVLVYVNEADEVARERVTEVAADLPAPESVEVVAGPDEYKAGEPTMALEAIEGNHRLEARRRPPGPAEYGLFGRPTLVHTPRTLVQVVRAVATDAAPTRLVTVEGDVSAPATVELPEDAPLSVALGAVEVRGSLKAACVGGRFGGLTRDLEVAAAGDALSAAGLGTEGVVEVLAEGRCLVAFAGERAAFAEAANCGRCVPCREGSVQLARLLRAVYDGAYEPEAVTELGRVMAATSVCGFGVEASRPATTALAAFEEEFLAHAEGTCPTGACDPTDPSGVAA